MDFDEPEDITEKLAVLGTPKAEFAVRGRVFARNLLIAPLMVLAGLALLVLPFVFMHGFHEHLLMFGIALTLGGIMLLVRAFRNLGLRVLIFPEGVVRFRRDEAQALFWDEIDTLWRKKIEGHWEWIFKGSLTFTLQRADGKAIHFDDAIPNLKGLGEILQKETLPHLWRRYLAAFEKGATLDFGKIQLSRRGLSTQTDNLPWHDVAEIKLQENLVSIVKKGKWTRWFQCKVSEIPNCHVFKALVERALATREVQRSN
jgi:hypothetical protein